VRVLPTELTQPVTIVAPKEVRSSSPLSIALDVGAPGAFATIAVVDEGILSLTHFKTPDPLADLFSQRALGVETFETIGWTMLHNPSGTSSRTGGGDDMPAPEGGEGALAGGRVQPVKPVALFSGIVQVGPDGKVTVPFQIPSYRGQVRVMAVVAGPTKIGHAEADVLVRDPLVVQATFPRFVTQNDEIQIPVFLTNMSGGPLNVNVKLDSVELPIAGLQPHKGGPAPIQIQGKDTGSVQIQNGKSETLVFAAKATLPAGGATLRVVATAGNLKETDTLDVPFLPAGPKDRVVQKVKLQAGTLDLATQPALKNWVPTSASTRFWITNNPYGESFQNMDYLVHYPYGCIEQTVSSTRPLLYITSLVEQVDPKLAELKVEDIVLAGINRIFAMETPSGGFGYWPGATDALEWATAYATDMLLDAKKAGYAVPDDRLKEVVNWIDARTSAYERGEKIIHEAWNHYDEQAEAYLHYVLARAGRGKKARILKLIGDIPKSAIDEQAEDLYLLKAALYLSGDRRYAADLKAVDSSPINDRCINSWSFYSDRRRRGEMLSVFFDLFGADPAGEPLASRVAEMLAGEPGYYYNTQELVWGMTGLGKWVMATGGKGTAGGTLTADGQRIAPRATLKKSNDKTWALQRASEYKSLTLDVPDSANGMWLVISSEGVRPNATYKTGGNGLAVSHSYHALDSTEIQPSAGTLHLGDLVFVEIDLENTSSDTIRNVALVDRLPAGFEIENPRLGRTTKPDWVKDEDLWAVDFMNMRDDHLEAFGTLGPHQSVKLVYTVRAVTAGKFTIPPIEAGAMYDPTLWARDKAGTAVIGGPWGGKLL
jgi:alpha-2-macroglobulin